MYNESDILSLSNKTSYIIHKTTTFLEDFYYLLIKIDDEENLKEESIIAKELDNNQLEIIKDQKQITVLSKIFLNN